MTDALTKDMNEVADEVLRVNKYKRQPWVSDDTLLLCDKRREKKASRHNGTLLAKEYKMANTVVRQALGKDKETWIKNQCLSIKTNPKKGYLKEAYAAVRRLVNKRQSRTAVIENESGEAQTETKAVENRWK